MCDFVLLLLCIMMMSLNCKGRLLRLHEPQVMGILNITTDSFFDGGRYVLLDDLLFRTEQMLNEGAAIIDVGAASSRPGAEAVPCDVELERIVWAIGHIAERFPEAILSVDTVHSMVARCAVDAGAHLVNDISGGEVDSLMFETVAALGVPYILMHMRGTPTTMQRYTQYEDIVDDILAYFADKLWHLRSLGVYDVVLDVGFGFSKTVEQNHELLHRLGCFLPFGYPLLAGISRKSMIYKPLGVGPQEALHGTGVLNWVALQQGARLLRVHDVKEAMQVVKLWSLMPPALV